VGSAFRRIEPNAVVGSAFRRIEPNAVVGSAFRRIEPNAGCGIRLQADWVSDKPSLEYGKALRTDRVSP